MRRVWCGMLLVGLLLTGLSVWQVLASTRGLRVVDLYAEGTPVTVFLAQNGQAGSSPVILIGHGFAGSGTVMRGFALTLAHAGYNVLTWDFSGHGANPGSLGDSGQRDALVQDAERALREARLQGLVNEGQVAILGHSMGSGVALAYGILHPDTRATIAVSPVMRQVTPDLPQNLLLLAGSQEPSFLATARTLLAQAGGEGGDPGQGTARKLVPIPGANHLTILFSDTANRSILEWFDTIFGVQPGAAPYTDRRMAWFTLGLVGTLLAAVGLAWRVSRGWETLLSDHRVGRKLAAMAVGVLAAISILWLLGQAGLEITRLFGLLVGGYLMIWFALAGVTGLILLRTWPADITIQTTLAGVLTFVVLWLGVGLLSHMVWLPWMMIRPRLVLWPLAVVCLLPWFQLQGEFVRRQGWVGQTAAWLANSILLLGGLYLSMQFTPGIGFLILIMPVFPIFFGLHALAAGPYRGGWPFALSGALFTAWMLLVVFPLG